MIKKILAYSILLSFTLMSLALPTFAESNLTDSEIEADDIRNITSTDTISFVLDARWGFVRGNPDQKINDAKYDGSIYTSDTTQARISLNSKLLFEKNDTIALGANPVSWNSTITSHWDGVRVNIRAKADASIIVKTIKGDLAKTAQEWFTLSQPAVLDYGDNEMLVVRTYPNNHRRESLIVWWGIKNQVTPPCPYIESSCTSIYHNPVNFSGSLTMDPTLNIKLKKTLRFEDNDKINEYNRSTINWTSTINNGRDGLYALLLPSQDTNINAGFTLKFNELNGPLGSSWTKHYTLEDIASGKIETIHIGNTNYIVAIGRKNIVRQLVKERGTDRLYLINNNIKQAVDDLDILHANGFSENGAVELDPSEIQTFASGEKLEYPDGTVVDDDDNSYVLHNGVKRQVGQGKITNSISRREYNVKLGDDRLNNIPLGEPINLGKELTDNALVTVPGDTAVWRIRGNKRQVFTHVKIFELHRLDWSGVRQITPEQLQQYKWAPPVEIPDGTLVKIPTDPKVYLLENGARRWVETEDDLKSLGYQFNQIIDMSPTDIVNYPESDPIIVNDLYDFIEF